MNAKCPSRYVYARWTASTRQPRYSRRMRCATTSASVSDVKRSPPAIRAFLSSPWFSMMPLSTIAISSWSPAVSGWALRSVTRPCVAQRVCPMPIFAPAAWPLTFPLRFSSFPTARTELRPEPLSVQIPAES